MTLNGNPPFLDLPSTGWDNTGNVGRDSFRVGFGEKTSSMQKPNTVFTLRMTDYLAESFSPMRNP
ncbi:hypothetical protein [Spirosoma telluris]|uniref:hypothetical protein n=1 Tax=Spirosoma telluris TaxID=2183553 RepID=UPI002FC3C7E4